MELYKPTSSSSNLSQTVSGIIFIIDNLLSILKTNFPAMSGQISSLSEYLEQYYKEMVKKTALENLTGHGNRATVLRQIAELFPERNIEGIIEAGLPRTYKIIHEDYDLEKDLFRKFITHTLSESTYTFGTDYAWLVTKPAAELDEFLHGSIEDVAINEKKTGFYNKQMGFYAREARCNVLVLVLSDTEIFTFSNGSMSMDLYVPIEGTWITITDEYLPNDRTVFDFAAIRAAYEKFLTDAGIATSSPWTAETLFEHLYNKMKQKDIQKEETNKVSGVTTATYNNPTSHEAVLIRTLNINSKIANTYLEFTSGKMQLMLSKVIDSADKTVYNFFISIPFYNIPFEQIPIRIQAGFVKWIENLIDQMHSKEVNG